MSRPYAVAKPYVPKRCYRCWIISKHVSHAMLSTKDETILADLCVKCANEAAKAGYFVIRLYDDEWHEYVQPMSESSSVQT